MRWPNNHSEKASIRLSAIVAIAVSTMLFGSFVPSTGNAAETSEPVRISQYVTVRDGTRLAIDVFRPSVNGKAVETPLPTILVASLGTNRQEKISPDLLTSYLLDVLKRGYAIAFLETRGHGASFGKASPLRIDAASDYWDLFDVIEWLAARPWSDGKIGMAGCSNQGLTQFRAAAVMPPQLKAIAPTSPPVDWATMGSINGITTSFFAEPKRSEDKPLAVDEDPDGSQLEAALTGQGVWGKARITRPFRDAPAALAGMQALPTQWWNFLPSFISSKTPVFQYSGWRDFFPEQALALYRSLARQGVPQKLIIGPWYHCEWYGSSLTDASAETARWYDHWLKGIENGVMDEPPIRYYVVGAPAGREWKTADRWPLPNEKRTAYFLAGGGALRLSKPELSQSKDDYVVDYTVTTAKLATRWNRETISAVFTSDQENLGLLPVSMSDLDARSLTYTSEPLKRDAELTGFPVVTLWVSSTAEDQDFFVYLEEVASDGKSTLLTEGAMRASNRAMREPPFDNEELPWHPGYKADQEKLQPGQPTKLEWALFPFSNYIEKGHRLRITVNSFDKDAWDSAQISPAPRVSIHHDAQHHSSIALPFILQ